MESNISIALISTGSTLLGIFAGTILNHYFEKKELGKNVFLILEEMYTVNLRVL